MTLQRGLRSFGYRREVYPTALPGLLPYLFALYGHGVAPSASMRRTLEYVVTAMARDVAGNLGTIDRLRHGWLAMPRACIRYMS